MSAGDTYPRRGAPKDRAAAVTKSDATVFAPPADALFVGGAGNVVVDTAGGDVDVTFAVGDGAILPVRVVKVKAATTATGIVRLWG